MNSYAIRFNDELEHHGILGQKWGKKNGPPYPLDASKHSASEKKAGWKKSIKVAGSKNEGTNRNHQLTDEQKAKVKKLVQTGAVAVGVGLAAYGAYKYKTFIGPHTEKPTKLVNYGKKILSKLGQGIKDGAPDAAYNTGKKISAVMVGGMTWLAGMEIADLMTDGAATKTILTAYNDHQKKDNKVKTSYRNSFNKDDDDDD